MESFEKRVSLAQAELKAPKNQYNSFGKYKYRSCEDILEAAKPINLKYGLFLAITDDISVRGDRIYISATATLNDTESDKHLSVTAYAREPDAKKGMDESQVTGTASSYARKYALNGLYCIDDTKDADTDEHEKQTGKGSKEGPTEPVLICEDCGQPIKGYINKNGDLVSSKDVTARTKNAFGKMLCLSCGKTYGNNQG